MPVFPSKTAYIVTANPDTLDISPTDFTSLGYRPAELGLTFEALGGSQGRQYQIVQLDSGVVAATSGGVVAANQLAFWKDRATYLTTNDYNQSIGASSGTASGGANEVAGIYRNAVTTRARVNGYATVTAILQKGRSIPVKTTGSPVIGDHCRANVSTPVADAAGTAAATACPTQRLGTFVSTVSGGNANVDLDIASIP